MIASIAYRIDLSTCLWTINVHHGPADEDPGLVSLVNGISTFVGYLMSKLFLLKDSSVSIRPIADGIKDVLPFSWIVVRKWT